MGNSYSGSATNMIHTLVLTMDSVSEKNDSDPMTSSQASTIPSYISRLGALSNLDRFQIKGARRSAFKIKNSSGSTVFLATPFGKRGIESFDLNDLKGQNVYRVRNTMKHNQTTRKVSRGKSNEESEILLGNINIEFVGGDTYDLLFNITVEEQHLVTRQVRPKYYDIRDLDGYVVGHFEIEDYVKGSIPQDLDVRLKAGILSAAIIVRRKKHEDVNDD